MPRNVAVLDDFNRANGAAGANWSANPYNDGAATLAIVSNVCKADASWYDHAWWNPATAAVDASHYLEVAIRIAAMPSGSGGSGYAIWCSLVQQPSLSSSTADAYEFGFELATATTHRNYILEKANGATAGYLYDNTAATWAVDDLIIGRLYNDGTLKLVRDRAGTETEIASVSDATLTGTFYGSCGVYDGGQLASLDDFSFGAVSLAGPESGRFSAANFPKPKLRRVIS